MFRSNKSNPARQCSVRPALETLEDRMTPAISVTTAYEGTVVVITGDENANAVAIVQDDANNTLSIFCDGAATPAAVYTSSQIVKVTTDLKGGADNLWWGLAEGSHLQFSKDGYLSTGNGDDVVNLDFWHGIGNDALLLGSLGITVDTGEDNDLVDADFGRKHGGSLTLLARMGAGDDEVHARMWGDMTGGADVKFDLQGGAGQDLLSSWNTYDNVDGAYGKIKVASDSTFHINANGGSGDDSLHLLYQGELDGKLTLRFYGGMGNDLIGIGSSEGLGITLKAGSTGILDAIFRGDQDNDLMAVTLTQQAGSNVSMLNALMDGGAGYDKYHWGDTTANLTRINFESTYPFLMGPAERTVWDLSAADVLATDLVFADLGR